MSRAVRLLAWACVFASLGATTAAWVVLVRDRPELEADDATDVALGALDEVGIDGTPDGEPVLVEHTPENGEPLRAWSVMVRVESGEDDGEEEVVELRVRDDAGQLVFVDDNLGDGERLLTDEQFDQIGRYRDDAVAAAVRRRNAVATVATVLIAVVGYTIATRAPSRRDPSPDDQSTADPHPDDSRHDDPAGATDDRHPAPRDLSTPPPRARPTPRRPRRQAGQLHAEVRRDQ